MAKKISTENATEEKSADAAAVKPISEVKKTISKAAEPVSTAAEPEARYIYAGASLPGIKSGTVISGKIPEKLNEPFVRELVMPIEKYPAFIRHRSVDSSREAYCFRKSAEYAERLKNRR